MKRRQFMVMLCAVAAGRPVAALAQGSPKRPLIGVLGGATAAVGMTNGTIGGFRQGLRDLGYIEGQNVDVAYRFAEGDPTRLPSLAQELVALKPDVLFAPAESGGIALKAVTQTLPIVIGGFNGDSKLFASDARPGGNVTGIRAYLPGMAGKLLEIATETIPGATKFGILAAVDDPGAPVILREIAVASERLKVEIVHGEVHNLDQIEGVLQAMVKSGAAAVVVTNAGNFFPVRQRIASLAAAVRLPAICSEREFVVAGALTSYGVDNRGVGRRATSYVDKILKGAAPADLPIEFPTTLTLAINLKTAKALGITISPALMMRADEVIE